jgi:hypothetical protein
VLGGTSDLTRPHRAGDLGGQPVLRHQQRPQPVQQHRPHQRGQVLGGERIQGLQQLVHEHPSALERLYEG